jgi:hypothetical protein
MRKLTFQITEGDDFYGIEFITDRTPQWTIEQYTRHRKNCVMELIGDEPTDETELTSRKI